VLNRAYLQEFLDEDALCHFKGLKHLSHLQGGCGVDTSASGYVRRLLKSRAVKLKL
jgi:hypothetical protein